MPSFVPPVYVITLPAEALTAVDVDPRVAAVPPERAAALAAEVLRGMNTERSASILVRLDGATATVATLPRAMWLTLHANVPDGSRIVVRGDAGNGREVRLTCECACKGASFDKVAFRALLM